MSERLSMLLLGVLLSGGSASAGEDSGRLTLLQAAVRLRQGIPVYSCPVRPDWFSGVPGQCPGVDTELEWVEDIQKGKAVFGREKGAAAGTTNRIIFEDEL